MMSTLTLQRRQITTALQRNFPRPRPRHPQLRSHRLQSNTSKPPPSPPPPPPSGQPQPQPQPQSRTQAQTQRLTQILTRATRFLPKRLQTSLQTLRSAPLSHIGAFLLLHEITAILPIFGLTYAFHALDWVPTSWVLGPWAAWAEDGLRKYVPYFRRKRWFGLKEEEEEEEEEDGSGKEGGGEREGEEMLESELRERVVRQQEQEEREGGKKGWFTRVVGKRDADADADVDDIQPTDLSQIDPTGAKSEKAAAVWLKVKKVATVDNTGKGYKIGVQIAAAYAITKLLLVPRIALSLWLTPWLARGFIGLRKAIIRRKRS